MLELTQQNTFNVEGEEESGITEKKELTLQMDVYKSKQC